MNEPRSSGINTRTPNAARMYDYFLGGKDNFAADRAVAGKILEIFPDAPVTAQANRDFMHRAVRHLAAAGVDQFLDVGSGLPTRGNVHEVADTGARVTYVDYDPMVLSHAGALLAGAPNVSVIQADLRRPREILDHPDLNLDLSRPAALLLVGILHYVPNRQRPYDIVAEYRDAMAPGSHLVLSHLTMEGVPEEHVRAGHDVFAGASLPMVSRPRAAILRFFDGFELIDPGLTRISQWRPGHPNVPSSRGFAGVARKI
jgi:O-methyltransferase involved in polyketide biosynthesis